MQLNRASHPDAAALAAAIEGLGTISTQDAGNVAFGKNTIPVSGIPVLIDATDGSGGAGMRMIGANTTAAITWHYYGSIGAGVDNVFGWTFNQEAVAGLPIFQEAFEGKWIEGAPPNGTMERHAIYTSIDRLTTCRMWTWSMNLNTSKWALEINRFQTLTILNADSDHALDLNADALTLTVPTLIAGTIKSPYYASETSLDGGGEPVVMAYKIGEAAAVHAALRITPVSDDVVGSGTGIEFMAPLGYAEPSRAGRIYAMCDTSQVYSATRLTFSSIDAAGQFKDVMSLIEGHALFGGTTTTVKGGCVEIRYPSSVINRAGIRAQLFVGDDATSQTADSGGRIDLGGYDVGFSEKLHTWGGMKGAARNTGDNKGYLVLYTSLSNSTLTEAVWIDHLQNVILGSTYAVGETASRCLVLSNEAVSPTTSVDLAQLYCADHGGGAGHASFACYQEDAILTVSDATVDRAIPVVWNGQSIWLLAKSTAPAA